MAVDKIRWKLASGRLVTKFRPKVRDRNGRWFPTKLFDTRPEAKKEERRLLILRDNGKVSNSSYARKVTLADYWTKWSNENRAEVTEGWKIKQEQMWARYIEPTLGSLKMQEILPVDVRRLLNEMKTRDQRSSQTRLHVYNLIHKIFEDACDEDPPLVDRNPARRRDRPKVLVRERDYLSPEESMKLLEASRDDWLGPAVWIGLLCGFRCEALQPLKVGNVNLRKQQILICEGFKRATGKVEPYPKGKAWEYIPMPEILGHYLSEKLRDFSPEDFVVQGRRNPMMSYNSFRRRLKYLCKVAGVRVITPHDLVHLSLVK